MNDNIPGVQADTGPVNFRKLPVVRDQAEQEAAAGPSQPRGLEAHKTGEEARAALAAYNKAVLERLDEVRKMVGEAHEKVDPTKDEAFLAMVRQDLIVANVQYVTDGTFRSPVSIRKPEADVVIPEDLDVKLKKSPAALAALAGGADLLGDD